MPRIRGVETVRVELNGRLVGEDQVGMPHDEERECEEHREHEHLSPPEVSGYRQLQIERSG